MKQLKEQTFQYILMVLAFIADIALIVNIIHHW
jgi:preprotein translocase subunit SecE